MAGKSKLFTALQILKHAEKHKVSITEAARVLKVSEKIPRNVRSDYKDKSDPSYKEFIQIYNRVLNSKSGSLKHNDFEDVDLLDKDEVIRKEETKVKDNGKTKEVDFRGNNRIKTLDDLIEETKIDLTMWKIDRHIVNKWDTTFIDKFTGEADISQNFQVKAFLSIKQEALETFNAAEVFKELLAEYNPVVYKRVKYEKPVEKNLLEINIFDLHLGKLCWAGETGENYDVKIASKRFMQAIQALIARASSLSFNRILFPIGNDFFNSDTILNTTTEGTPQDEDLRWQKTFKLGVKLLVEGIDYMRQFAPVDIVIVPGNHDTQRCFFLGETLAAWYRNADDVNVDNRAPLRKYYRYGKVLIGLTHGNNEKEANLPMHMTVECRKLMAETEYWEWHLGHFHKKKAVKYPYYDENLGITIRYMSSLAGTDAWHFKKGFIGTHKAAEAYLWNEDTGYIGQYNVNMTFENNEDE